MVGKRMVRSPGEIAAQSVGQRRSRSCQRPAHRSPRTDDELGAPGKPQLSFLARGERSIENCAEVVGAVHARERIEGRQIGGLHLRREQYPLRQELLSNSPVLLNRKPMSAR